MIRTLICIALAAGALFAWPHPAQAAQSYDNCTGFITSLPATISTQGTWCLRQDVATSMTSGNAIIIATNNVAIDCNHFKIGGLAAGTGTTTTGIRADDRFNATVRNCNIRGFYEGVNFNGGGCHLVEDSSFDGNTFAGIFVASQGSTVRNNLVIDTGGSTVPPPYAYGIAVAYGVDVINNTVNGVAPSGTDAYAIGINTYSNGDGSIDGNRVRGLAPAGTGVPYGIFADVSGRGVISDNHVQGPGPSMVGGVGVRCMDNQATARDNVVAGFATGVASCYDYSNAVNVN